MIFNRDTDFQFQSTYINILRLLTFILSYEASFKIMSSPASSSQLLPYDPPGEVPTTVHLDAYMDEGRPMLNKYTRHSKIGGGQHGEVYLCYEIDPTYPLGHPERRRAVVSRPLMPCLFFGA